jgi:cytochrome c biogenesis protein CcmG/thiol:disulfide interchange protein DsbE
MKTGLTILAGLLAGFLVAAGVLAAFVFVGPDPVGLRPTPPPTLVPPSASAAPSASSSASAGASGSAGPSASAGAAGSAGASADPGAAFHIGQPAPVLVVPQVGGGTIGKPVWLNFMQTTCPECVDEFPLMNSFSTRYADQGLVVMAIDIREDEGTVASFAIRLKATFPLGLDGDGTAQQAWGTYALPIHFWIDKDGIVRDGALGGVGADAFAAGLRKILPGVTVTP